jgi:hypothetical protein
MFRIPWQPVGDAQYVESMRQAIARWDRYRPLLLVSYVVLLGLFAWSVTRGVNFLVGLAQPANAPWPLFGFVAGTILGVVVGWLFHFVIFSMSRGLAGFRTERLLVKYHDAIAGTNQGS